MRGILAGLLLLALVPAAAAAQDGLFPPGFLWGTATSSYQVEGGIAGNDWAAFEKQPGRIANGDRCGAACEFWTRYRDDLDRAQALHTNAFRLSIEWSRVEPAEGRFDEAAIDHYRDILAEVRKRGMIPFVTLFHFCTPDWLAKQGGWTGPAVVPAFERYATKMGERLGDLVDIWTTQNETMGYLTLGYLGGVWAPGYKNPVKFWQALGNSIRAHGRAYAALHRVDTLDADGDGYACSVGVVHNYAIIDPYDPDNKFNAWLAAKANRIMNHLFLDALTSGKARTADLDPALIGQDAKRGAPFLPTAPGTLDHIGINYYTRFLLKLSVKDPLVGVQQAAQAARGRSVTDGAGTTHDQNEMGWLIYPEGIYRAMMAVTPYRLPIFITENGIPDRAGKARVKYIADHLRELRRAIRDGAPVRGYIHWALLDNFEWAEGYWPRFGLYAVDYATQARTLTEGGAFFAEVCRNNGLTAGMLEAVYPTGGRDEKERFEKMDRK